MKSISASRGLLVVGMVMALTADVRAQTIFGSILGTATDTTGAVVAGVQIRVVNVDTNSVRRTTSDALGNYEVAHVPPGLYRVEAEHPGFRRLVRDGIELQTRQVARVDLRLSVGDVETQVSVVGGAPLVETETARIADVRSGELLRTLPLNTISIFRATVLTPGVLGNVTGSTFSFNGSWSRQASWTIDGVSMSDVTTGTQIGPLANNLENVSELKIDLSNNSAESGAVGTVTMTTRSGTNQVHGSLFEAYSAPDFRAKNPFTRLKSRTVTHQYGGSVGGPVWIPKVYDGRDRTFFYVTYMDWRDSARTTDLTPTVPLASWKRGDFSDLLRLSAPIQLRDPATGQPFPGNIIPGNRINLVASGMQERFYPDPNSGDTTRFTAQNWRGQMRPPARNPYNRSVRVDHKISESNTISGRVVFQHAHGDGWLGGLPTMGQNKQVRRMRQISVVDTHVLGPTLVNEFRFGNPRDLNDFSERAFPGLPFVGQFGIQGLAPDLPSDVGGLPRVRFSGLGSVQNLDVGTGAKLLDTSLQFYNQLSWFRGGHSLKFGVQYLKARFETLASVPAGLFGDWLFTNRYTGWAYTDFLLGLPSEATRQFPDPTVRQRRSSVDLFVQDDFRIRPRLTLNVGLRYEYHKPWIEAEDLMANFDVGRQSLVIPDGASARISPLFTAVFPRVNVIEAREAGVPARALVKTDRNNFAPRVGLAFRPFGHTRSVVRGGYGIFYNVAPLHQSAGGSPFKLSEPTFINPAARPELVWPLAYPSAGVTPGAVAFPSFSMRDPRMAEPYTQQWNVTVEQQIDKTALRLSYVGTAGRLMEYTRNINVPEANSIPYILKPRPLPEFAAINVISNGASHTFHALQTELERRIAGGLYYQIGYTWSKDLGDHHVSPENPFDRRAGRSQPSRVPNHRMTGNFLWELPVGQGRRFASTLHGLSQAIVGGWQLSGIVSLQSGDHLTPLYSAPDIHTNIAHTTSLTPPVVARRPDRISDGNLPSGQQTIEQWFDLSAFKDPGCPDANPFCTGGARVSVGRFGNAGVNVIEGPGSALAHLGLYKNFPMRERVRLQFQLTATNIFNRQNWSNPNMDLSNPVARGRITGVGDGAAAGGWDAPGAREMRLGLRIDF